MIKNIVKILSAILLLFIIIVFYLSFFGIKTEKFNNQIINSISKNNKKINLNLNEVYYLLNPYNFSINIKTDNPQILLEGSKLEIKDIKTNISVRSLINSQFSIDDLEIKTKEIKLSDLIVLVRSFQNSPQLFILDSIIKDGFIVADIKLNFDEMGRIKENYLIDGSIKKAKVNILNKLKLHDFNFDFYISKDKYSFKQIDTKFKNVKIRSPLIKIEKKKNLFFVNGQILNDNQKFNIEEFKLITANLFQNIDIKKMQFNSINDFSFNINDKLKIKDLKIKTSLNLKELILNGKNLKLKSYFPDYVQDIKFKNHKIIVDYGKNKFYINGSGNILIEDKLDNLSYSIIKNDNHFAFDSKINLKNNLLLIDFLDYKKKEGHSSTVIIKGSLKKNDKIKIDLFSLSEKNNQFLVKGLDLDKKFKIINIEALDINYKNNKKILNKIKLKKNKSNFLIEGESFDASEIINNIMDSDKKSSSIFQNLDSNFSIKIKKTYIDDLNYINNLSGNLNFNKNKINNLKLESSFPNGKKINLSVKTTDNLETITKLSSDYPKPLIKRYNFIKGFEEGTLEFYSIKKNDVSNSVLVIENFKIKEVPVFAKLLTLSSLQGLTDILTGEGIRFSDFEMSFSNQKGLTTIDEMYAIGPVVSILLDGYIETKKLVSLRGTLVPATTINRSIASIPLLGKILIGDKTGEGVFGVSFKIKGPPKKLKTSVNPIKSLTPRFISRTLEKIKKN